MNNHEKKPPTTRKAVALRYDPQRDAVPVVVAKGQGIIAEKMEEVAREAGVALHEDKNLLEYLMALDLYQGIPPALYPVVAEILAYIYRMDRRYR